MQLVYLLITVIEIVLTFYIAKWLIKTNKKIKAAGMVIPVAVKKFEKISNAVNISAKTFIYCGKAKSFADKLAFIKPILTCFAFLYSGRKNLFKFLKKFF